MELGKIWQRLLRRKPPQIQDGVWCLVANVAELQVYGELHEVKQGTRHFSPGTKVYCYPPLWGDGYERVQVIGHHRGSPRLIELVLPTKRLTNWRAKVVYHPFVMDRLAGKWTQKDAESMAEMLRDSPQNWHRMPSAD